MTRGDGYMQIMSHKQSLQLRITTTTKKTSKLDPKILSYKKNRKCNAKCYRLNAKQEENNNWKHFTRIH